jgi:Type VI secretion system/phage-baseplate injector OB domain
MSRHGFALEKKIKGQTQFFGKYRARVTNNADPRAMGRIKVECPKVLGAGESAWCMPCLPPGVKDLPNYGDLVWIEFEGGDVNYPIWSGMWYAEGAF